MPGTDSQSVRSAEVLALYPPQSEADRALLLDWIGTIPLVYGAWKPFKALYKKLEVAEPPDYEILAALIARLDVASFSSSNQRSSTSLWKNLGQVQGLALRDDLAFVASGDWNNPHALHIFDISDAPRPMMRGSVQLPGTAGAVILHHKYVCIATPAGYRSDAILHFIDASDIANPRLIKSLDVGQASGVFFQDDRAFVVARRAATKDEQKPNAEPLAGVPAALQQVVRSIRNLGGARNTDENYIQILQILDISNLEKPQTLGTLAIPDARDLTVSGNFAYVVTGQNMGSMGYSWASTPREGGLRIVDISAPAQMKIVGSLDLKSDAQHIIVSGECAYISTESDSRGNPGVRIIDISQPHKPQQLSFIRCDQVPVFAVQDERLYLRASYTELRVYDVSDAAKPKQVSSLQLRYVRESLRLHNGHVFMPTSHPNDIALIDVADAARPVRVGQMPRAATIGYMKRRARRRLRELSKRDSDAFIELAQRVLTNAGHAEKTLDLNKQWVSADLLFANSPHMAQRRHGRGAYVARNEYYKMKRREERAPQAWDNHLDSVRALLEDSNLPWQTHEFALRLLLAHDAPLPALKKTHLARWLQSDSPLLITTATRHVAAQMEDGKDLNAATVARAYLLSGAPRQRRIEARLAGYASTEKWSRDFAAALFEPIAANTSQQLTRRQIAAALLLAREFDTQIVNGLLLRTMPLLFSSGRSELAQWAAKAIARAAAADFPNLLVSLEALPHAFRSTATEALMHGAREQNFGFDTALKMTQSGSDWTRQTAWQVLSASRTEAAVLRYVWEEFLSSELDTPALRTAMTSPHALQLLERAGIAASQLAEQLRTRVWLLDLLTPEVFARIADQIPAAIVLQLMQSTSDQLWSELRPLWLQTLRGPKIVEFWRAAWAASDAGNTAMAQRILNDAEVVATFNQIEVDDFSSLLQTENTIVADLLRGWLQTHQSQIEDGDALLLAAATHGLAPVRSWGLSQAQRRGVTMPFALRLLEAELPQTVAAGQAFFESAAGEQIIEYSLALCDSPQKSVRDYGRQFIAQREALLPHDTLLSRLFENPNPDIQEFVAALLQNNGASATLEFNQAVLRTRNRARRAKELVKRNAQRQPETQPIDMQTLLEMARSRTPHDAEWALCQLAQLAVAGHEIEGFSTEGTAGI